MLQKASVPLIDRSECSKPSIYGSAITPRMLCAGFLKGNIDACQVTINEKSNTGSPSEEMYIIVFVSRKKQFPNTFVTLKYSLFFRGTVGVR